MYDREMLIVLAALLSAAPESVFVIGSTVRVRAAADAKAAVVVEVPIGTACSKLAEPQPDGWVQVQCGEAKGFTRAELVSATAPDLGKLVDGSRDPQRSASDRYTSLQRAVALADQQDTMTGQNRKLLMDAWRPLFFAAEYEHLKAARAAKKTSKPRAITGPPCGLGSLAGARSCSLSNEFPTANWIQVEDFERVSKGHSDFTGDFIGVVFTGDGTLTVLGEGTASTTGNARAAARARAFASCRSS